MKTVTEIQTVIDGLTYDFTAFTLPDFIAHLERIRQRPIIIRDFQFEPDVYGLWLAAPSAEYIFVSRKAHAIHRTHIVLHETAHMLLKHRTRDIRSLLGPDLVRELGIPNDWGYLRSASTLMDANNPDEVEAERFVMLVRGEIIRAKRFEELIGEGTSLPYREPYIRAFDLGEV